MSSLIIAGDTSGTVTLQAPAVSGSTVLTLPATSGTVMVNGAAFSAYKSASNQSIANATFTKITFDAEDFDTNSNFASSTFTPTVAGYYQVTGGANFNGSAVGIAGISIYKNGSRYKDCFIGDNASSVNPCVTSLVYFNGSTDYVEIYAYQSSGGAMNVNTGNYQTYFNGSMTRGA